MSDIQDSIRARRRFALFIVFVTAPAVLAYLHPVDLPHTPDAIREEVTSWGALGPLVFIGLFVVRPLILFPSFLLFIAGGLAFGALWGTLYSAIGGTVGGALIFLIARALGREFVMARLGPRLGPMADRPWGVGLLFVLNMLPIVPVTGISYAAGLSRIGFLPFVGALLCGLTPRALAYSFIGSSLVEGGLTELLVSVALLLVLIGIPLLLRRRVFGRPAP